MSCECVLELNFIYFWFNSLFNDIDYSQLINVISFCRIDLLSEVTQLAHKVTDLPILAPRLFQVFSLLCLRIAGSIPEITDSTLTVIGSTSRVWGEQHSSTGVASMLSISLMHQTIHHLNYSSVSSIPLLLSTWLLSIDPLPLKRTKPPVNNSWMSLATSLNILSHHLIKFYLLVTSTITSKITPTRMRWTSFDLQRHVMVSTHKSGHTLHLVLSRSHNDLVLSTLAVDHGHSGCRSWIPWSLSSIHSP